MREHTHRWQPGPFLPYVDGIYSGSGSRTPSSIVLVCKCGELWRKPIPGVRYERPEEERR